MAYILYLIVNGWALNTPARQVLLLQLATQVIAFYRPADPVVLFMSVLIYLGFMSLTPSPRH